MADFGLTDLDKKWFDFTSNYVDKLSEVAQDWAKLSEEEQGLAALWKLEMDMYNGGFIQFFCNWGFECYTHAVRSLNKLQANECLSIITRQYSIIQRLEDDDRLQALWDIPQFLTGSEREEIDKLDQQYWDNQDSIVEKTFATYNHLTT